MNPILKKCIDELDKPTPRLDYLRGILETLYETNDMPTTEKTIQPGTLIPPSAGLIGYTPPPTSTPRPLIIPGQEAIIRKLKGDATIETIQAPLNAPQTEVTH